MELAKVIIAIPEANTYEQYCQQLHQAADQLASYNRQNSQRNANNAKPQSQVPNNAKSPSQPPKNQAPAKSDPNTIDWEPAANQLKRRAKWVDDKEIKYHQENHLCLRYGDSGHMINKC
jgi:hypothetical protein